MRILAGLGLVAVLVGGLTQPAAAQLPSPQGVQPQRFDSQPSSQAAVRLYYVSATWADVLAEPGWPTWYKVKTVPTSGL